MSDDDEPEAAWLRAQIDDELERWLRARWSRQREQLDDEAWRRYDWQSFRFGNLVWYTDLLPATWDTLVAHEGSFYKVEDLHCIKPGCTCEDVCLIFSELRDTEAVDVGRVTVSVPKLKATEATTPLASALWAKLRATKVLVGELERRRRRMREIGKAVQREGLVRHEPEPKHEPMAQPLLTTGPTVDAPSVRRTTKVGRNDPCPCGSGRKYKRCCLGKGSADRSW
ncbi:YecA family protein [Paraliomyxa miuraensis]|uniref:YecA family protein n=1 Tax=Paraliomyxa miuraensis TaxID=376150 RepID=UPI00225892BA|nr:SEC-C metal-binding domain-containing protein [Paraliomyxa miuraensis]MCX4243991.1 SEC-C metal-binding domain-containing protein [Paraliomyxa miuraensis]